MSIEERLEQLEKQMQFYKRLVIVLAMVIVAGVTMGQTSKTRVVAKPSYGKEIEASQFIVVDHKGRQRIFIGMFGDDPGIRLYDEKGGARISLETQYHKAKMGIIKDGQWHKTLDEDY